MGLDVWKMLLGSLPVVLLIVPSCLLGACQLTLTLTLTQTLTLTLAPTSYP